MNRDSDLAKAYQHFRAFYAYSDGPRRHSPAPACEALARARKALAALPALEEAAKAAGAALEAQRPIDCRRYAPAWVKVTEEAAKARKALQAGQAWKYSKSFWKARPWHGPQSSGPGLVYFEKAAPLFRNIKPASEVGGRYSRLNIPEGYYCDEYQENICRAFVFQLRGRKGRAFFVPGFQFSESDNGGFTIDLSPRAIESAAGDNWEEAEREAAKAADQLAKSHAEREREYDSAWQAGRQWAELKEEEEGQRTQALAILAERRAAMGRAELTDSGFFALCDSIRASVAKACRRIAKSRAKRAELVDSIYGKEGRAAFCDGAELGAFPS